jgi:hypothetical protein
LRAAFCIALIAVLIHDGVPEAAAAAEPVPIQAFVTEHCIVADEPFYLPSFCR